MHERVESVFITGKLNHRPPLSFVPSMSFFLYESIKTSVQIFWVYGYRKEKFPRRDWRFSCLYASEHKKENINDSIVHNGCDFTKQMLSNEQPGSQLSSFY